MSKVILDKSDENLFNDLDVYSNGDDISILRYTGNNTKVNIPTMIGNLFVTEIEWGAFYDCNHVSEINIPASVMEIGERAFNQCVSLTKINIPRGITKISKSAFSCCRSLIAIDIPDSVTKIENNAFSGCRSLEKIKIPY